jgi:hypothetical protein
MPDRHEIAFPEGSDAASVSDAASALSSNPGENVFPDICVFGHVGDPSKVKSFKGKLDTGANICLMAEHVVTNRWGIERIDSSKCCVLDDLGPNGIRTLGQIRITLRLGSSDRWLKVPFQVIPDSYVRYRYDALLSDKLIKKLNLLLPGPGRRDGA